MRLLKMLLVTLVSLGIAACGGGPTDPNSGMGDDDDMMLTAEIANRGTPGAD